jgi:hypothetical protein
MRPSLADILQPPEAPSPPSTRALLCPCSLVPAEGRPLILSRCHCWIILPLLSEKKPSGHLLCSASAYRRQNGSRHEHLQYQLHPATRRRQLGLQPQCPLNSYHPLDITAHHLHLHMDSATPQRPSPECDATCRRLAEAKVDDRGNHRPRVYGCEVFFRLGLVRWHRNPARQYIANDFHTTESLLRPSHSPSGRSHFFLPTRGTSALSLVA